MCGIVGYTGPRDVVQVLLDGLSSLEYRGYDSAGIAMSRGNGFTILRRQGKLQALKQHVAAAGLASFAGGVGIGHTRWATHGRPSERNAHPHRDCTGAVILVHNGIIENHVSLRADLLARGHAFATDTDSEVIAHLIEAELPAAPDFPEAVRRAVPRLRGAYSIVCVSPRAPGLLVAVRSGPPLIVGVGQGEGFVTSDIPAMLPFTRDVVALADGQMAVVTAHGQHILRVDGEAATVERQRIEWDVEAVKRGGYPHFMLKEIMEQPEALRATIDRFVTPGGAVALPQDPDFVARLDAVERVALVACGTSWHAALLGKLYLERLARFGATVEVGSEYRYGAPVIDGRTLAVFVTQSGETADTLGALREARRLGALTLAITNVASSMAVREAHASLVTAAGPEIGVAASKTFTAQIVALYALALGLGERRGTVPDAAAAVAELRTLPHLAARGLALAVQPGSGVGLPGIVAEIAAARDLLFIGRGLQYPIALEGALKLKELSYIHAEGYPAGELKHGPIALIDRSTPVVALVPRGVLRDKILSNIEEIRARDGVVIAIAEEGDEEVAAVAHHVIPVPAGPEELSPVLATLPVQLLAYHVAVARGCDVDQPRNLAKSVTVE